MLQLAIAPVFLVTVVIALLSLLASRLARIIDRARALESEPSNRLARTRSSRTTFSRSPDGLTS